MLSQFFKHFFLYTLSGILTRSISLILLPLYTGIFSPQDYGIMDLIGVCSSLIMLTIPLEISQGLARFLIDAKTEKEKTEYSSTAFLFTLFSYFVFGIVAFLLDKILCQWVLSSLDYIDVYHAGVFSIILGGLSSHLVNQLKWELKPKAYALVSNVNLITSILCSIIFVLGFKWNLVGAFWASNIGAFLGCLLSIYYVKNSLKLIFVPNKWLEMVSFSAPLVISSTGVFISLYTDRIMIRIFLSLHDLGIFGIAGRFASIIGLLLIGLQNTVTPLVMHHYKETETPENIAKLLQYFLAASACFILGLIIFSEELVIIFTKPQFYPAALLIPIIAFSNLVGNLYIFSPGLTIAKKTQIITFVNIFGAIINLLLNAILLPTIGLYGSALATAISAVSVFALFHYYAQKNYPINFNWFKNIIFYTIFAAISYLFLLIMQNSDNLITNIALKSIFTLILFLIIYLLNFKAHKNKLFSFFRQKIPN